MDPEIRVAKTRRGKPRGRATAQAPAIKLIQFIGMTALSRIPAQLSCGILQPYRPNNSALYPGLSMFLGERRAGERRVPCAS